jgi:isocitrate dehydrogenase
MIAPVANARGGAVRQPTPVTVAYGDGIGPEIMAACLKIMRGAGAQLAVETIELGEKVYLAGHTSGIAPDAWESLHRTRVLYKAPIMTPQGSGYKSLNVTLRKAMGLYANVRPCSALAPYIQTKHPTMDLVIIRENEEDLYAGIEHRQSDEVYQCLKLVSRPGCEKIIRYAFEYARANGRRKVSAFTKDNIMKLTDGLFHTVFNEIAAEYPDIQSEHLIVDIGAARLADTPERFDVIVTLNLYGDILSDVAAQLTGSVGLAGSSNIGESVAMFEAIHGTAPDIAGKGLANPSGLLLAGVMMLVHIGQPQVATAIHNAWLAAIEDGCLTADIAAPDNGHPALSTDAFADAVIAHLGKTPQTLKAAQYRDDSAPMRPYVRPTASLPRHDLVGVDLFLDHEDRDAIKLGTLLTEKVNTPQLKLTMITNRGIAVWPTQLPETFCTDHWRCRFMAANGQTVTHRDLIDLLARAEAAGLDFIKTENLVVFDGKPGFSMGHGQ